MKIKVFLALLLSFCVVLPVLAQTKPAAPPQPQQPSDDKDEVVKITTNLVQVDAVVTKDGKYVTNLTADDFEIYEDGKKQTITSFAYISNMPGAPSQPVTTARDKGKDPAPFAPIKRDDPHRTIVFVVDDLGLSAESASRVRQQLRKFVTQQLQPNDLVAIVRTGGEMGALQQFTNDRRILNRAVDQVRWNPCSRVGIHVLQPIGGPDVDGRGFGCAANSYRSTIRALKFILDGMSELPGRKSMVVLSDSMPMESQDAGLVGLGDSSHPSLDSSSDNQSDTRGDSRLNFVAALQRLAEKAIRASVVIYSVDTQGLVTTGLTAADSFGDTYRGNRNIGQQISNIMSSRSALLWTRRQGGDLIARQTGGYQVRNSNSFELDRIVEDQSGYYLLGYRPTDETFNRRFHHIKAKVKRSGMTLRTRFGFFGVSEEEAIQSPRSVRDLTNLALASPFAAQDVNIDITSFFVNDKTTGSMIRSFVFIDAKDLAFTPLNGRQQAGIDLHGVIFGDNGAVVAKAANGATVSLTESEYQQALREGMQVTFDIPVKRAGPFQVRIAARDKASLRLGSAGQFVTVPDLSKKKLAVSGIVLGTGRDSTGQQILNPGARQFTPNSELHFVYILYNGMNATGFGNYVMQTKLFRDDKDVYTGPAVPISAANQPDYNRVITGGMVRLPADLEPGSYYLQVSITEADAKKPVPLVQWAEFDVEKSR